MLKRNQDILTRATLHSLLSQGFDPCFRSLAGLFKDAAQIGIDRAYQDLIDQGRISKYDTEAYKLRFHSFINTEEIKLLDMAVDGIGNAMQYAARLGYEGYKAKFK